jgi:2-amino-4-ketopentanoate thiolase alpha subunit
MAQKAKQGDWVQIHNIILTPGQRAPQVPDDTKQVPLEMWLKGFLNEAEAELEQEVSITTVTGRRVSGRLVAIAPAYPHNFGQPVQELLTLGSELRDMLAPTRGEER